MKTREIGKFALQSNGIGVQRLDNLVIILLSNERTVYIVCPDKDKASTVANTILYYPTTSPHAGHEFDFEIEITFSRPTQLR